MIVLDDKKELFELIENVVRKVVKEELAGIAESKPKGYIKGIKGLAEFLNIGMSKAQQMKNDNSIPYTQYGRTVLFDPEKVSTALAASTPKRR